MTEIAVIVKKYGVNGILCICLWWMNDRLSAVEQKLYNCYENQVMQNHSANNTIHTTERIIAILPDEKNNIRHARTERNV